VKQQLFITLLRCLRHLSKETSEFSVDTDSVAQLLTDTGRTTGNPKRAAGMTARVAPLSQRLMTKSNCLKVV